MRLRLHLAEHGVHYFYLDSASVTGRAGFGSSARRHFHFLDLNGFLGSVHHFLKIEFYSYAKVAATLLLSLRAATAAEMSAEDIAKLAKDILHIHSATETSATETSTAIHSGMAELVVTGFLIIIA